MGFGGNQRRGGKGSASGEGVGTVKERAGTVGRAANACKHACSRSEGECLGDGAGGGIDVHQLVVLIQSTGDCIAVCKRHRKGAVVDSGVEVDVVKRIESDGIPDGIHSRIKFVDRAGSDAIDGQEITVDDGGAGSFR